MRCRSVGESPQTKRTHCSLKNNSVVRTICCCSLVPLKLKMFSPSGELGEPVLRKMSDGDMQDTGEVSGDGGTFR